MARFTTIVALVAVRAGDLVTAVEAEATNVTAVQLGDTDAGDDGQRRRAAWSEATRRRNVYTLIDFDPLSSLVDAWVERLQGDPAAMDGIAGLMEDEPLPEYHLVGDDLEGDVVHWYHGFLREFAPHRVVPITPQPASVIEALAHLKPAPAFPAALTLARAALDYVPTGLSAGGVTSQLLAGR